MAVSGPVIAVMVMRRGIGAGEQHPRFPGIELRGNFLARRETGLHMLEGMGPHDRGHHLLIDRQRHIDRRALDHRRPVLVAEAMAEFEAGAQNFGRREALDAVHLDDEHFLQRDAGGNDDRRGRIVIKHVAVVQVLGARQRDGQFHAALARLAQAVLGRFPLLQHQRIDHARAGPLLPERIAKIAEYALDENHVSLRNNPDLRSPGATDGTGATGPGAVIAKPLPWMDAATRPTGKRAPQRKIRLAPRTGNNAGRKQGDRNDARLPPMAGPLRRMPVPRRPLRQKPHRTNATRRKAGGGMRPLRPVCARVS